MKLPRILAAAMIILTAASHVWALQLCSVELRSTSVVKRTPSGDRQFAKVVVDLPHDLPQGSITIRGAASFAPIVLPLDSLRSGRNVRFLEIIPLTKTTAVRYVLTSAGKSLATGESRLVPPRKWTVYDVEVSHHDLGYADYYHLMRRDVREMGMEMALDFCKRTDAWDANSRFHWTVETSEPLTKFISSQPAGVVAELVRRIKEGRIDLGGLHNSVSTEMLSPELMSRLFYTPNRTIVDLLGVPPSRTALITDVVGFSRTLPLFLKEADIPYFYHGYNETINGLSPASKNPVFFWRANDADSLTMPLVRSFPYYSPDRLLKYDVAEISALLLKYEADPLWVYDCLIAEDSYDFSLPQFENVEGIRLWNEQYANPVLRSGTFTMFFDDLMRQADRRSIPAYDMDGPNAWADQDGSDARLMADARMLNYRLPEIERLSTLVYASGGKGYPWKELWESYHKLLSYHEHTNGAFSEEDVLPIPLLKDRKAANANYYECEQVMHKGLVKEATALALSAHHQTADNLSRLITVSGERSVVVFNSLNWERNGLVHMASPGPGDWSAVDVRTGTRLPTQHMPDGSLAFHAEMIPSMGYRTFRVESGKGPDAAVIRSTGTTIENEFYAITLDTLTGAVASIRDKKRRVELVDQNAPHRLAEYVYQRMDDPGARTPSAYHPTMLSCSTFSGPYAAGITSRIRATGSNAIEQTVTLYANSDVIEFRVKLDKSDSGRMLKQNSSENKEALFYAMPLNVQDFTIHHELAGGVVEPLANQFTGSTSNFFGIQHFSDLSNSRFGVTIASVNAPLVGYGPPRPALWAAPSDAESIIRKPEKSHLFFYLMNNMFFTNIPVSQPGPVEFSWCLRAHDGGWVEGGASRFGWEASHPLEAIAVHGPHTGVLPETSHSFVSVDHDHVVCSTIKPAEANGSGFILRFVETAGKKALVRVTLPFIRKIGRACETNLVEAYRDVPLRVTGNNTVEFDVRPFGLKTIRVIPVPDRQLTAPLLVQGTALSDREVNLNWNPVAGASFYRVYRGTTKAFAPGLITCVAQVTGPEYTDHPILNHGGWLDNRLEPGTTYWYRVEAVGKENDRADPSEAVRVMTHPSASRNSRPNKVLGLEATNVSPVTGYNYISLLFYTNVESDVVRYRVYRGEQAGFTPDSASLLDVIDATRTFDHVTPHAFAKATRALRDYTMIVYPDESTVPNKYYFYRVAAVDAAGQEGENSDEASAQTEIRRLAFEGSRFFFDSVVVDIRPFLQDGSRIRYTTDGSIPSLTSAVYTGPFSMTEPAKISAAFFRPGETVPAFSAEANFQRALYPPAKYVTPYSEKWPGQGLLNMVDGKQGSVYTDASFQGFEKNDMDVIVDLGGKKEISSLSVALLQDIKAWIFFPVRVEFFVSHDGANFEKVGDVATVNDQERKEGSFRKEYAVSFGKRTANFVRVRATNIGLCPPWHGGFEYKGKAWLFADEIVIE